MLRRVFYVSQIALATKSIDIRAIVSASLIWNRRHDVTGVLVASAVNFAQVLECRSEQMELVLQRIRNDPHHHSIYVQIDEPIKLRRFARWAMSYVQRQDLAEELARLHSSERTLSEKLALLSQLEPPKDDALSEV